MALQHKVAKPEVEIRAPTKLNPPPNNVSWPNPGYNNNASYNPAFQSPTNLQNSE